LLVLGTVLVVTIAAVCIAVFIRASSRPMTAVVLQCEYVAPDGTACVHGLSQHEDNGGPCHGQVQKMLPSGEMDWVPCGCPGYRGDTP
jgi:hypothetical protein